MRGETDLGGRGNRKDAGAGTDRVIRRVIRLRTPPWVSCCGMSLKLKRAYEPPSADDGYRVLVDRLWPRGVSKDEARVDEWLRDLAPSAELRKWFAHDPEKWTEFRRRYLAELKPRGEAIRALATRAKTQTVTLLFAAKDEAHNNAVVLRDLIKPARR